MDQQRKAMGLPWRSSSSKIRRLKFAGKNRRSEYVFQKKREKKKKQRSPVSQGQLPSYRHLRFGFCSHAQNKFQMGSKCYYLFLQSNMPISDEQKIPGQRNTMWDYLLTAALSVVIAL